MKRQRDAAEVFTVASRRKLLLEPASSATDAAHATISRRESTATNSAAARERPDHRQAIVDRRVRTMAAIGAWIARIAVNSTAANYDREDSAEYAADVASTHAAFTLSATSCRGDRLGTWTWKRSWIDWSRGHF